MESGCCCKTFQLGKCFDRNDTLIATCEDMFNATVASKCNSISNTTNNFLDPFEKQFYCSISGSCEPQDPPFYVAAKPARLFIFGGIVVILGFLGWLFGVMKLLRKQKDTKQEEDRKGGQQRGEEQSEEQGWRKLPIILVEVGLHLIIYGFLMKEEEFTILGVYYVVISIQFARCLWVVFGTLFCKQNQEAEIDKKYEMRVPDIYFALDEPFLKVMSVAVCQMTLMGLYLEHLYSGNSKLDYSKRETFLYYMLGALVSIVYSWKESNRDLTTFNKDYILGLIRLLKCYIKSRTFHWHHCNKPGKEDGTSSEGQINPRHERGKMRMVSLRVSWSLVANDVGGVLILFLLPIHLASSESEMDFVLNAVAAYFITELDDLGEDEDRKYMLESKENIPITPCSTGDDSGRDVEIGNVHQPLVGVSSESSQAS